MYQDGRGVGRDDAAAARWYRLATDQGEVQAQVNLGTLYYDGRGVRQDRGEAARWYHMAAEQGHEDAQAKLGNMYEAGRGVGRDIGEVIYWYRKAAEQGQADAQEGLAWIYATASDERHRNGSKAVKFARLAVAQEDSAYNRDTLAAAYAETRD
ncbi:MAG: tetratricopeptide repeat protein, partial [Alphaproteobacteria bacterium]